MLTFEMIVLRIDTDLSTRTYDIVLADDRAAPDYDMAVDPGPLPDNNVILDHRIRPDGHGGVDLCSWADQTDHGFNP